MFYGIRSQHTEHNASLANEHMSCKSSIGRQSFLPGHRCCECNEAGTMTHNNFNPRAGSKSSSDLNLPMRFTQLSISQENQFGAPQPSFHNQSGCLLLRRQYVCHAHGASILKTRCPITYEIHPNTGPVPSAFSHITSRIQSNHRHSCALNASLLSRRLSSRAHQQPFNKQPRESYRKLPQAIPLSILAHPPTSSKSSGTPRTHSARRRIRRSKNCSL